MIGIACVLAIVTVWWYTTGQNDDYADMDAAQARILKLERAGDVPGLAAEVANPEARVARLALAALGRVATPPAVEQIVAATSDGRPKVRSAAALAYSTALKQADAPLLTTLLLGDKDPAVRITAASAIARMAAYGEVESLLKAMLDDAAVSVRASAAEATWAVLMRKVENYNPRAPRDERVAAVKVVRSMWTDMKEAVAEYHDAMRENPKDD